MMNDEQILSRPLLPTNSMDEDFGSKSDRIGFLNRPRMSVSRESYPKYFILSAKRNYKFHESLGMVGKSTTRSVVILETGAGSGF